MASVPNFENQALNMDVRDFQFRSTLTRENKQLSGDVLTGEIIARIRLGEPGLVSCSHESAKGMPPIKTIEQIAQRAREMPSTY